MTSECQAGSSSTSKVQSNKSAVHLVTTGPPERMRTGPHHVFRIVGEDFSLFFYYNAKLIYDFQNLLKSIFIVPNEMVFFVQNVLLQITI